jgi:acetamidase/formamidase
VLCGTVAESLLTGTPLEDIKHPLLETQDERVLHSFSFANYLEELGPQAQSEVYSKSSVDLAMRDAFRKVRHFLITTQKLTEDEAISLMTIGVDFGITQAVDGNWGVHGIVKKALHTGRSDF